MQVPAWHCRSCMGTMQGPMKLCISGWERSRPSRFCFTSPARALGRPVMSQNPRTAPGFVLEVRRGGSPDALLVGQAAEPGASLLLPPIPCEDFGQFQARIAAGSTTSQRMLRDARIDAFSSSLAAKSSLERCLSPPELPDQDGFRLRRGGLQRSEGDLVPPTAAVFWTGQEMESQQWPRFVLCRSPGVGGGNFLPLCDVVNRASGTTSCEMCQCLVPNAQMHSGASQGVS